MNEFDVKRRLAQRSEQVNNESAPQMTNGIPNSVLADVFSGKQKATNEMMGRRSNLAPSIAAKMSQSFGMDVSGVQVYRSDAMAGSTMHGMAQGNKVVIGSDVDLNTLEGQAVLGHELSHIRAQSMGVGTGNGLLHDAELEQQADTEGMLAARGMNISGESMGMSMGLGMAGLENVQPIGAGLGATAAAPMQADDSEKNDIIGQSTATFKNSKSTPKQLADAYLAVNTQSALLATHPDDKKAKLHSSDDSRANISLQAMQKRFGKMKSAEKTEFFNYIFDQVKTNSDEMAESYAEYYKNLPKDMDENTRKKIALYKVKTKSEGARKQSGFSYGMMTAVDMFDDSDEFDAVKRQKRIEIEEHTNKSENLKAIAPLQASTSVTKDDQKTFADYYDFNLDNVKTLDKEQARISADNAYELLFKNKKKK